MTADTALAKPRIIRVRRDQGRTGLFYATSPDLRGLLASGQTLDELQTATAKAIADLYLADGARVLVMPALSELREYQGWVVLPVEFAQASKAANAA